VLRAFALGRLALWALFVAALSACSQTAVGTKTDSPASIIAAAPTVRASLAPGARTLSGQFFGYNLDYGTLKAWKTDQHLVSQTASMAAGTLRYPGGTVANYWNWAIGWYGTRPYGQTGSYFDPGVYSFSLQDLKQLTTASGATPIFDVNMMTATLQSQVAMLQAAQSLGMPVRFIELGNEFYLSNPDYLHAFPTALSYGQKVSTWMSTLRKDFPSAKIAAVGYAPGLEPTPRESAWNATVLKSAPGLQYLTMHIYLHPHAALGVAGSQRTDKVLALPFSQWDQLGQHSLKTLPSNTNIWITEFNMMNNVYAGHGSKPTFPPPQGTWTQGLFTGTMDLLFLHDPRIAMVDYHDLIGSYDGYGAINQQTGQLSPSGDVQQMIHRAAAGMTFSEPLSFTGGPMLIGKYPGLVGCVFRNAAGTADAVVLNLSNQAVSLKLPQLLSKGMMQEEISGAPSVTKVNELRSQQIRVNNTITLHPYAATYLYPGSGTKAN
jgi:hypothetical protein